MFYFLYSNNDLGKVNLVKSAFISISIGEWETYASTANDTIFKYTGISTQYPFSNYIVFYAPSLVHPDSNYDALVKAKIVDQFNTNDLYCIVKPTIGVYVNYYVFQRL